MLEAAAKVAPQATTAKKKPLISMASIAKLGSKASRARKNAAARRARARKLGGLLGCGNPVLNMTISIGDGVLEHYQLEGGSVVLAEEMHLPLFEQLLKDPKTAYEAGGAAQNTCRVCAWMLSTVKKEKRPSTAYVGRAGDDENGRKLAALAVDAGLRATYEIDKERRPTGRLATLVNRGTGSRTMVADLGASTHYDPGHLEEHIPSRLLEESSIIVTDGFFLTHSGGVEAVERVGKHVAACASQGEAKVLVLNLGAPYICEHFGKALNSVLPHVDLLIGNRLEMVELARQKGFEVDEEDPDIAALCIAFASLPKNSGARGRVVVATGGPDDTIVVENGIEKRFAVAPLNKQSIVDRNGAGDAFAGAFLSQLLQKRPVEDCVHAAHWAARLVIQRSGVALPEECDYA